MSQEDLGFEQVHGKEKSPYPEVLKDVETMYQQVLDGSLAGLDRNAIAKEVALRLNNDPGHKWLLDHHGLAAATAESVLTHMDNFSEHPTTKE